MSVICMNCKRMEFKMREREAQISNQVHLLEDIKLALYSIKLGKHSVETVVDAIINSIDKAI